MSLRGGRYELLGVIATGGMATVHLGRALGAGGFERVVAIKTMHPHLAREPEFVAMFLDEARLAARIRHPNVVGTLDIQQDEEGLFLVMELVEGPSLSQLVKALGKRQDKLPADIVLRIALDLLAGLHAAHELTGPTGEPLNLIHRDMSPHNVLVGVDGISRITDFGVARAESRLASTRSGSVKGKVMYMPPEQVRSQPVDRRADVYAAGVVLWEMLTGQRLIRGESDLAMMHEIIQEERKAAHDVAPAVPEPLSRVCARALSRAADLRYPTAAAFAEALEKAALECGLSAATPRAVGAFVRAIGVHFVPRDLPPISASPERLPLPSRPAFEQAAPAPAMPAVHAAGATAVLPSPPAAQVATDTRAVFAAPPESAPARGGRGRAVVAAGTVLVVAAAAGWVLFQRASAPGSGEAESAAGGAVSAAAATVGAAPVPAPSAVVSSAEPASSGAPSPSASASASASASGSASAQAVSPRVAPVAPGGAGAGAQPAAPRPGGGAAPSNKGYRPKEL